MHIEKTLQIIIFSKCSPQKGSKSMFFAFLPGRSVISLSGEEAGSFLQGLISNDINKLTEDNGIYAALLSPQGKFLHDFFLTRWQGKILLDVASDRAADVLGRL